MTPTDLPDKPSPDGVARLITARGYPVRNARAWINSKQRLTLNKQEQYEKQDKRSHNKNIIR